MLVQLYHNQRLVLIVLAILALAVLLMLALGFSAGQVTELQIAGFIGQEPSLLPLDFNGWGIDANRFYFM